MKRPAGAWGGAAVLIAGVTACSGSVASATGPRGRPSRDGDPLPLSSASNYTVQAQPPAGSCHARGSGLYTQPDPRCTPGAVSSAVTLIDIASTICRYGYTRRVRPPERISEVEKRQSLASYGDRGPTSDYEYDHLVPLELGGATNDARNLWPEPGRTPNPKDELERRLNRLVCERELPLRRAQLEIARDWVKLYRTIKQ